MPPHSRACMPPVKTTVVGPAPITMPRMCRPSTVVAMASTSSTPSRAAKPSSAASYSAYVW